MELAGLEPATSWVRSKSPPSANPLQERDSGRSRAPNPSDAPRLSGGFGDGTRLIPKTTGTLPATRNGAGRTVGSMGRAHLFLRQGSTASGYRFASGTRSAPTWCRHCCNSSHAGVCSGSPETPDPCPVPASREPEPGRLLSRDGWRRRPACRPMPSPATSSRPRSRPTRARRWRSARAASHKRTREPAGRGRGGLGSASTHTRTEEDP